MGFIEAIKSCLSKYSQFKGRSSRSEFWFFLLFSFIYFFIAGFLLAFIGSSQETMDVATLVLLIPIFIPGIAVSARRLHDINQSG